jgi:hypothetical protein
MRQVIANKLQTIIDNEKAQKERPTHKIKLETYGGKKRLVMNIKKED